MKKVFFEQAFVWASKFFQDKIERPLGDKCFLKQNFDQTNKKEFKSGPLVLCDHGGATSSTQRRYRWTFHYIWDLRDLVGVVYLCDFCVFLDWV